MPLRAPCHGLRSATAATLVCAALSGCARVSPGALGTTGSDPEIAATPATPLEPASLALASARVPVATPFDALDGTYYLDEAGARQTLALSCFSGECSGVLGHEAGGPEWPTERLRFDAASSELSFRVAQGSLLRLYRLRISDGVVAGRAAVLQPDEADAPGGVDPRRFFRHVTGWSASVFDRGLAPRVYDLTLASGEHGTLRLDRDPDRAGGFLARYKVYASDAAGAYAESDEYDAIVDRWDGSLLVFSIADPEYPRTFRGTVAGRTLEGTVAPWSEDASGVAFTGFRAEVLSHGFSPRSIDEREDWQRRTRLRLSQLMMNGAPAPLSRTVTVLRSGMAPRPSLMPPPDRDDGPPAAGPGSYLLQELRFDIALPDPNGGEPLVRRIHGYYAEPDEPAPAGGFPAVLALNGHTGSGAMVFHPDSEYFWYGDAYARRGYAVLAIDVGHRPYDDRQGVYDGYDWGDDTDGGNGLHPAIEAPGMDSDWEEEGERVFDVSRALDWLLVRPGIDARRVLVSGLSMGGEVSTFAFALEPRLAAAVVAGFSPDLSVLLHRGSHGCWQWAHASIREYLDTSDLHALGAPRPLLVETGRADVLYSVKATSFSGDLQVMRRSRAAFAEVPERLVHYLHYDVHHFHAGGTTSRGGSPIGVVEALGPGPGNSASASWQGTPTLRAPGTDLFALLSGWLVP